MKFQHTQEFYRFLHETENVGQIDEFREICRGGSSYNFYLKNDSGEFLVKLLPDYPEREIHFQKLKKAWQISSYNFPLQQENFKNYKILMLPFFRGKKLSYSDCSAEVLSRLRDAYNQLLKKSLPEECISEPLDFEKMYAEIEQIIEDTSLWMNHIIKRFFWQKFKKDLKALPKNYQVIHGDFTVNNILIDEQKNIHLIDFECFRYGYDFEDWGNLFLQLSGYRGYLGSFKRLTNLLEVWKKINPQIQDLDKKILQGMQMFYFKMLHHRLVNPKKRSLRKDFNLLVNLCRYFKLLKQFKIKVN